MLAAQRHGVILKRLRLHGAVEVAALSQELGVSEITIRRDLRELAAGGQLVRTHGGARVAGTVAGSTLARSLVGVVMPSSTVYFPAVLAGIEAAARDTGVRPVLGVTHYRPELEHEVVRRLVDRGVEGVLVANALDSDDPQDHGWLADIPVPVVILERSLPELSAASPLDHVATDHAQGAVLALRHLKDRGHEHVAAAIWPDSPTGRRLWRAWPGAVAVVGTDPRGSEPVALPHPSQVAELDELLTRLLDRLADQDRRAVFVHADGHASRLVELALERGMRVPEDLAVVSYDDETAALALVPLTAVSPPKREIGAHGLRLLMDRVAGRTGPALDIKVQPRLIVRESTGSHRSDRV